MVSVKEIKKLQPKDKKTTQTLQIKMAKSMMFIDACYLFLGSHDNMIEISIK
jgi:hypothetical protein